MNIGALRRRIDAGEKYPVVDVYPAYQYFEVNTTTENKHIKVYYNCRINDLIVDGIRLSITEHTYNNGPDDSGMIIPTPGFHKIYVREGNGDRYDGRIPRAIGEGLFIPRRYTTDFLSPPTGKITRLILMQETPPGIAGSGSISAMCSKCDKIFIPVGTLDAYIANSRWSSLKDKFVEVKYNFIEGDFIDG